MEEANDVARSLGREIHFAVYARGEAEAQHWERVKQAGTAPLSCGIAGAGRRLEKMTIEVTAPNEPTRLISIDQFIREHARLHNELRRRQTIQPANRPPVYAPVEPEVFDKKLISKSNPKSLKLSNLKKTVPGKPGKPTIIKVMKKSSSLKSSGSSSSITELSRKETEQQLRKILENTVAVTKVLEDQLREIKARGWNAQIY